MKLQDHARIPSSQIFLNLLPASIRMLLDAPLRNPRMWTTLAWMDVAQSYRRTLLGPAWITLNLIIFTVAISLVYGVLFAVPTQEYAAFLVCGMIGWMWVTALLLDVSNTFLNYGPFIKNTLIDKSVLIWAAVYKQMIILLHHLAVYFLFVLVGVVPINIYSLAIVPVIALLFVMSIPIAAVIAILFARFRDLHRLFSSVVIILMMITPIFWQPHMLSGWRLVLVQLNPLYHIVEFVRAPLLGKPLDPMVVAVVAGITLLSWTIGAMFYRRYQKYVVFWL